ncbi:MAG: sensor histidine kinase [Chloroflexota bacterium]
MVHLFERFYRVPQSENAAEGSSIGLAVPKKIVEQHGRRIRVASTVGEGTIFTIVRRAEWRRLIKATSQKSDI